MKTLFLTGLLAFGLSLGSSAIAKPPTNQANLIGVWTNTNSGTNNIVRVIVRPSGSGITVQPFGACSPTPCDHGIIGARTFSSSVGSAVASGFNAFKSFGFKSTSYNGIRSGTRLILLTQNTFASADTRFNYNMLESFVRTSRETDILDQPEGPATGETGADLSE